MNTLRPFPPSLIGELVRYSLDLRLLRAMVESELSMIDELVDGEQHPPDDPKLYGVDAHILARLVDDDGIGHIERQLPIVRARQRVAAVAARALLHPAVPADELPSGLPSMPIADELPLREPTEEAESSHDHSGVGYGGVRGLDAFGSRDDDPNF